jgi:pSer/pThr/pTyr-binding forkhead associated (FHA) protein
MLARLTVIAPKRPADQFELAHKAAYLIGRADDNDIIIREPSVSRQHARLGYTDDMWTMSDLNSMNGLRSNGIPQQRCLLSDGSLVIVGNVPVLFSTISTAQVQREQQYDNWRLQQATQLGQKTSDVSLYELNYFLSEALKLCQMERAALLVGSELASMTLQASLGVSTEEKNAASFFGSIGALQSVLSSRKALVANDITQHQALSQRASINIKQLSALACLPLIFQGNIVGLFYVDSKQQSKYLSAFDLELLQTLVDSLTLTLFTQQMAERLQKISLNVQHS